jgi:hypothetical protein
MMQRKGSIQMTLLLSAKLLLVEQWFEVALALTTVSGTGFSFIYIISVALLDEIACEISVSFGFA